ncbi:MAG: DUF255 domain-containing protein [Bdellovibrionales bacterium]|nr:DUF255 domain-containing protein [Bdellovibrionales bacterium]
MTKFIAVLALICSSQAFAQTKEKVVDPHPVVDKDTLDAKLMDRDRIIIIDVGAEWCHWCKKLEADSLPEAEKAYGDQLRIYHIIDNSYEDTTPTQKWVESRHVTYSLPGVTLVRNGRVLSRFHGYQPADKFLGWIRDGLNGKGKFHTKKEDGVEETEATKLILTKKQIATLEKSN